VLFPLTTYKGAKDGSKVFEHEAGETQADTFYESRDTAIPSAGVWLHESSESIMDPEYKFFASSSRPDFMPVIRVGL
jgi:hypothetical protein